MGARSIAVRFHSPNDIYENWFCVLFFKLYGQYYFPRSYQIILWLQEHSCSATLILQFIENSSNKVSYGTTIKNNLDYLKLKVIKPTQVLGLKPTIENRCASVPTFVIFHYPGNRVKKNTEMYIHQNMGHSYHKKIQDISDLGFFQRLPKNIPHLAVIFTK